ncbi:N-acetylmuramoyl-L-alanine amidase family protein [Pseudalkalibacillus hwajinpoensis]|uniref:N-acetylmuramoyl-L-alanine amidase n=1 Tax=Guptibacillus hwajinpoensis TaxID=208199 RepID=A0A4U1MHD5_9BACL|nr:N-acetylmuramoyl-L-alanine amidase [Pseudalkalibacillus hwajinpoensis]TKD70709.1 N-acetylmuramoyl-L-alanine amidase [Pseudalkalibacillus hwajinpoensis]
MSFKSKAGILVSALLLISLFATFFILKEAYSPVTNKVVDKQAANLTPIRESDGIKKSTREKDESQAVTPSPKPFLIVIDPGHQKHSNLEKEPIGLGRTETKSKVSSGTSGVSTNKPEYQLTLEAALILKELLEERGIDVVLTRDKNEVDMSNKERAELANHHQADLFVRLHADGSTDQNVKGFHILTPAEGHPIFEQSLQASKAIINTVQNDRSIDTNGISFRSDITGFNWSKVPTTLIEMGFMTNPEDDANLSNQEYLRKLMRYIADGIVVYRGQAHA